MFKLIEGLLNLNVELSKKARALQAFDEGFALMKAGKYREAAPLLKESAELGYPQGMATYASMLTLGRGGPEDGKQAVVWLERAIGMEEVKGAKATLGMLLATGKGGAPIDQARGRKLLESAVADENDVQAAEMISMMDRGVGIFAKRGRKGKR